jgi:hypothetical protein
MICGLPPIGSSWRQAPRDSRPETSFQLNTCCRSLYVTSFLTRRWVCLLWICLAFVKCMHRIYSMLLSILDFALYTSATIDLAKQIISNLLILRYNGSLVTGTVVSLTPTKFKPLIFSMSGFALSYTANRRRLFRYRVFSPCRGKRVHRAVP